MAGSSAPRAYLVLVVLVTLRPVRLEPVMLEPVTMEPVTNAGVRLTTLLPGTYPPSRRLPGETAVGRCIELTFRSGGGLRGPLRRGCRGRPDLHRWRRRELDHVVLPFENGVEYIFHVVQRGEHFRRPDPGRGSSGCRVPLAAGREWRPRFRRPFFRFFPPEEGGRPSTAGAAASGPAS